MAVRLSKRKSRQANAADQLKELVVQANIQLLRALELSPNANHRETTEVGFGSSVYLTHVCSCTIYTTEERVSESLADFAR